jgi:hypothetical protein
MSKNESKSRRRKRLGRPPKSGAYSPICRAEFLEEYPEIRAYIQAARDGLIADQLEKHGGKAEDDLTAGQRIMIDRQVSKLTISRQIESYIRRNGILRRDRLQTAKVLEAEPILVFWLNLQNSLDRGLATLGLEPVRKTEDDLSLQAYVTATYGPASQAGQGAEGQQKADESPGAGTEGGGPGQE